MADQIGPAQYSQILRRENEGGTPLTQTSLLGGTNWAGIQGGRADTPIAPGGQFSDQASIDNQAVNQLLTIAGKEVKKRVDDASTEAYMRGVSAAASGQALEDLVSEKVKTGFWNKLVPKDVMELGYKDYMAMNSLEKAQTEFLRDQERLAELSPEEANKHWMNVINSHKIEGDEMHNSRMMELATPIVGTALRENYKYNYELTREKEKNARVNASISAVKVVGNSLNSVTDDDNGETQLAAIAQLNSSIQRADGETYSEWQERLMAMVGQSEWEGQPLLINILQGSGIMESLSPADQVRLTSSKDAAENRARVMYSKNHPDRLAAFQYEYDQAKTAEEKLAVLEAMNVDFQKRTGAIGASFMDMDKALIGIVDAQAKSAEAQIQLDNQLKIVNYKNDMQPILYAQMQETINKGDSFEEFSKKLQEARQTVTDMGGSPSDLAVFDNARWLNMWDSGMQSGLAEQAREQAEREKAEVEELQRQENEKILVNEFTTEEEFGTEVNDFRLPTIVDGRVSSRFANRDEMIGAANFVLQNLVVDRPEGVEETPEEMNQRINTEHSYAGRMLRSSNPDARKAAYEMFLRTPAAILDLPPGRFDKGAWDGAKGTIAGIEKHIGPHRMKEALGEVRYNRYKEMNKLERIAVETERFPDAQETWRTAVEDTSLGEGNTSRDPPPQARTITHKFLKDKFGISFRDDGSYNTGKFLRNKDYNRFAVQTVVQEAGAYYRLVSESQHATPAYIEREMNKFLEESVVEAGPILIVDTYRNDRGGTSLVTLAGKTDYGYDPKAMGGAIYRALEKRFSKNDLLDIEVNREGNKFSIYLDGMLSPIKITDDDIVKEYGGIFEDRKRALEITPKTPRSIPRVM